ncbi:MAG: MarR family transcriptional regulator [Gemmatimonadaceae bacterium]
MPPRIASPPHSSHPPRAPDPLAEPLHRHALHLLRRLRLEDAASGLSAARLSALSVLVFGGPTTLGALAAAEQVSAPTMTRIIQELERDGWVRRRQDAADARVSRLEATAAAVRLLHDGRNRRLGALSRGLARLEPDERRAVALALPALGRVVEALRSTGSTAGHQPGHGERHKRRGRLGRRRHD